MIPLTNSGKDPSEIDRIIGEAAHEVARRRVSEMSRDTERESGIEAIISAIEHGGDEFSEEDVENFRRGHKDLIEAPKAMRLEAYLKAIEKVSKNLDNALQPECARIIALFPYRLR